MTTPVVWLSSLHSVRNRCVIDVLVVFSCCHFAFVEFSVGVRTFVIGLREKGRDLTQNATKTSITQRLQTDLGRSVGVTAITPLVWQISLSLSNKQYRIYDSPFKMCTSAMFRQSYMYTIYNKKYLQNHTTAIIT